MKIIIKLLVLVVFVLMSCVTSHDKNACDNANYNDALAYYSQYMTLSNALFSDIISKEEIQFYLDSVISITDRALDNKCYRKELIECRSQALKLMGSEDEALECLKYIEDSIQTVTESETSLPVKTPMEKVDMYIIKMQELMNKYYFDSLDSSLDSILLMANEAIEDVGPDYRILTQKLSALDRLKRYDEAIDELSKPYSQCINGSMINMTTDIYKLRFRSLKALSNNDSVSYNNYLKEIEQMYVSFLKDHELLKEAPFCNPINAEYRSLNIALLGYYYYYSLIYGEDNAIKLINNQMSNSPLKPSLKAGVRILTQNYDNKSFVPL